MPGLITHGFGFGHSVGTSFEPITSAGVLNWLTAASAVRIKAGGNANDTAAGTGARSVLIHGLDANFEPITETVVTAGALASDAPSQNFIRVWRAEVATVGTYGGTNTAVIDIETTGGTLLIEIGGGESHSEFGAFTVPANRTIRLHQVFMFAEATKETTFKMLERKNADIISAPFSPAELEFQAPGVANEANLDLRFTKDFPAKCDVWFEAKHASGTGDVSVDFEYETIRST